MPSTHQAQVRPATTDGPAASNAWWFLALGALVGALGAFAVKPPAWARALDARVHGAQLWLVSDAAAAAGSRVKVLLFDQAPSRQAWQRALDELAGRDLAAVVFDAEPERTGAALLDAVRRLPAVLPLHPGAAGALPDRARVTVVGHAAALPGAAGLTPPPPELVAAATALGFRGVQPEADGVVRRMRAVQRVGDACVASLCIAAAMRVLGENVLQVGREGRSLVRFGGVDLPLDPDGAMHLLLRGPAGSFATTTLEAVAAGEAAAWLDRLRHGDIVVIGARSDAHPTATAARLPDAEIVATALDNVLRGAVLQPAAPGLHTLHAALLGACAAWLGSTGRRLGRRLALAVLALLAWFAPGVLLLQAGVMLPTSPALIPALSALALALAARRLLRQPSWGGGGSRT